MSKDPVVISKDTIKRLLRDIKELIRSPLCENGIYYHHSETDMLKGYALIIGQSDTPYYGGYYFFEFHFPADYPHSPPLVTYHTNGQNVRFHPNFYKNGKVCISILNTWTGEQWSSCQTITTILLTLCMVLCKNPLLNEPGTNPHDINITTYNDIITYANINVGICDVILGNLDINENFSFFNDIIYASFLKNYEAILNLCNVKSDIFFCCPMLKIDLYLMQVRIIYPYVIEKLEKCKLYIEDKNIIYHNKIELNK